MSCYSLRRNYWARSELEPGCICCFPPHLAETNTFPYLTPNQLCIPSRSLALFNACKQKEWKERARTMLSTTSVINILRCSPLKTSCLISCIMKCIVVNYRLHEWASSLSRESSWRLICGLRKTFRQLTKRRKKQKILTLHSSVIMHGAQKPRGSLSMEKHSIIEIMWPLFFSVEQHIAVISYTKKI